MLPQKLMLDTDIIVFSDIGIQMDDDISQMAHLVIHTFGVTIIESKSVTSEISSNEQGEWIRHYKNQSKGMLQV